MRLYKLTKVGRAAAKNGSGDADEVRVLNYLQDNKTATDDQLDVVGERWVVKTLKSQGLIKELTS